MNLDRRAGIFFSALMVAVGGIIYELILSTASSYLVGDSILQFSITIGTMLFAMGIGSWIAPHFKSQAESKFILIEGLLALIGGNAVSLLFLAYTYTESFYVIFLTLVVVIGIFIGLEIPTMLQIVGQKKNFLKVTSRILSLDYFGALIASLAYPLFLLPTLGVLRTAYLVGLLNVSIAILIFISFFRILQFNKVLLGGFLAMVLVILGGGFITSSQLAQTFHQKLYQDEVIFQKQTPYQKIVITKFKEDIRMYLDGNIQFSSIDEYRYHEPLVHIPLALSHVRKNILVLGGGDGLAAREILKHAEIEKITLVDLDTEMTKLAQTHPDLLELNQNSLQSSKVLIINQDAMKFLESTSELYDVIIIDLPDPNNEALAKLYSAEFYRLVKKRLAEEGVFVTQATSPYFSLRTFWMIKNTIEAEDFHTYPYHVQVPSFGEWGFVIGSKNTLNTTNIPVSVETQFLTPQNIGSLFIFDKDIEEPEKKEVSTLMNPLILSAYQEDVRRWQQ